MSGAAKKRVTDANKKKAPIQQVSLDDLFGKPTQKGIGAPIISLGSAFKDTQSGMEGFDDADDYSVFSFDSDLNVDATRSQSFSSSSSTTNSINSSRQAHNQRRTDGPMKPQEKKKPTTGSGWFGQTGKTATQPKNKSVRMAPPSKTNFSAVYKSQAEMFEFESPFQELMKSEAKHQAIEILSSRQISVEEKARRLFLLDQLNKPAPPVRPPKNLEQIGQDALNEVRRTKVKKLSKKGVAHKYDPSATAMGIKGGGLGFVSLVDLINDKSINLGWRIRVEIVSDVAFQLKRLHAMDKAHNAIEKEGSVLVSIDAVRGAMGDEKGTVAAYQGRADQPEGNGKIKRDIFGLGLLILMMAIRQPLSTGRFEKLCNMIEKEKQCGNKKSFEELDDKLYDFQEGADREVRLALSEAKTPGSLLELCAQCCSGDRSARPTAVDAWDWLDSILGDMDKVNSVLATEDNPENLSIMLKNSKLKVIKNPTLADVVTLNDVIYDSDASIATEGYASDDSYQPPLESEMDKKLKEAEDKRKSKLGDFLSSTAKTEPPARPVSMNASKLKDFVEQTSSSDPLVVASIEAETKELTRRRSLDRGYMWAKQKFVDAPEEEKKEKVVEEVKELKLDNKRVSFAPQRKVVANETVEKLRDQWKVAQSVTKARSSEEVAQIFSSQQRLSQEEAIAIIKKAETIMRKEKNLIEVTPPVCVIGDIHGQFFDLINMLSKCGKPGKGKTSYVFLGDYVDRGDFSCEVLLYLLALKAEQPDHVFLLRGNHECKTVSSYFGFKEEADNKYGNVVFQRCLSAFQAMPMAAIVETQAGRFLCCHGGISPNITSLEQFVEYNRFIEPGMNGFLCDLLWSDPVKDAHEDGTEMSLGDFLSIDYLPNPARGCSYRYGFKALVSFLAINKLVAIIRAHEVMQLGYKYHFQELTGGKSKTAAQVMPPVITIFSAPNYCERYGNKGAFLRIHPFPPAVKVKDKKKGKGAGYKPLELLEPVQFSEVPHPPPMQVKNQTMEQQGQIVNACPYMPTTFHAFLKRATDLAEKDLDVQAAARERARASRAIAPITMDPEKIKQMLSRKDEEKDEVESVASLQVRPKSLGAKVLKSIGSLKNMVGIETEPSAEEVKEKADKAAKKNWKALQQLGLDKVEDIPKGEKFIPKAQREQIEKFEAAAENDGVNEMNPMLLEEKIRKAQEKLAEKNLNSADETTLVVGGGDGGRKTLTDKHKSLGAAKRSSQRLKVGDGLFRVDSKAQMKAESPITEEEQVMTFTKAELLALQMLFLIIDRQDKGLIDVEDLVAWSADEGYSVPKEEAELCVQYVDADQDGKIGFEDYLAFAARSKDLWLVSEFSSVLNAVKTMQRVGSKKEMPKEIAI